MCRNNHTRHHQALDGGEANLVIPRTGRRDYIEHNCCGTASVNGGKRVREFLQSDYFLTTLFLLTQMHYLGIDRR
ncbi:hypothetical protein A8E91_34210 [Burkholderia cenocepacia]|nr:hypothetical protein A8E88_27045 [Burkholderia cenocepacia]ONW54020.1 hypothetical protein A8E91_34210 [Burkholderia cenocepacia]